MHLESSDKLAEKLFQLKTQRIRTNPKRFKTTRDMLWAESQAGLRSNKKQCSKGWGKKELEAKKAAKARDDGLQGVDQGVEGLGEAAEGGALLRLLNKGLEGGQDLLEGRHHSTKGTTEARLVTLHHLAELAEKIVDDRSNGGITKAATGVDASEGGLKLRDELVHVA